MKQRGLEVAFAMSLQLPPLLVEICHCMVGAGVPVADALKQTFEPSHTVESCGCRDTTGGGLTVNVAAFELAVPQLLVNTARY